MGARMGYGPKLIQSETLKKIHNSNPFNWRTYFWKFSLQQLSHFANLVLMGFCNN